MTKPKRPRKPAHVDQPHGFNFRINADVTSHQQRLVAARHPSATQAQVEPSTTPQTRVTYGPSYTHDPRHQCAPGEQPFGAGFSAVGIGRDLNTGRPWA